LIVSKIPDLIKWFYKYSIWLHACIVTL
jgi:hypothetical protein